MINFENELENLKKKKLFRSLKRVGEKGVYLSIEGKKCLNLSSNDYLDLSEDERLKRASIKAVSLYGTSSSSSRLVCGNLEIFEELEEKIAKLKGTESALIFNSGYQANISLIPAIVKRGDVIIFDKLCHASIVDGVLLSRAEFKRYSHNDLSELEKILKESKNKRKIILTESVFSMDGDLAPLREIVELKERYGAILFVDEAHATGIFGGGAGLVREMGLEEKVEFQMATFSKAFGSFGAYVCCSKKIRDFLINRARGFIYSTALPPNVVAASKEAVDIVSRNPQMGKELLKKAASFRNLLKQRGLNTLNSCSQIIPIICGSEEDALLLSEKLFENSIFVPAIRPPTVPENTSRLRISLTLKTPMDSIEKVVQMIGEWYEKNRYISRMVT